MTAFWLFVKDIQHCFSASQRKANEIAGKIWSDSPDREVYLMIANRIRSEIRENGWAAKRPYNAITLTSWDRIVKYLDNEAS